MRNPKVACPKTKYFEYLSAQPILQATHTVQVTSLSPYIKQLQSFIGISANSSTKNFLITLKKFLLIPVYKCYVDNIHHYSIQLYDLPLQYSQS